jgi:hypothetical protein
LCAHHFNQALDRGRRFHSDRRSPVIPTKWLLLFCPTATNQIAQTTNLQHLQNMSKDDATLPQVAPPAATGNAGPQFEGKVGAFYLLSLLIGGEPRGVWSQLAPFPACRGKSLVDPRPNQCKRRQGPPRPGFIQYD